MQNETNAALFDVESPLHLRLLAEAIMAEVEAEEVVNLGHECVLTDEAEARLLQMLAAADCTMDEVAAVMRLEGRAN